MIQCPNCGGLLKFDIASQQMRCDSCSSFFDPYAFEMSGAEESTDYDVTIFRCPQCGGEITSTDETAAGFCSYCGSSNVLESRISKEKRPQLIIPFKKSKKDCTDAFEKFIKRAIFAPKSYREAGKADSFRGIYMPYWLYDMSQRGDVNVATSDSHRSGDYIITDHYMMRGTLDCYYNGVSYDASSSFADDISSDIAPFNVKDITRFSPSFLSGYYADIADVEASVYRDTAVDLAQESTYNYLKKSSPMAKHSFDTPKDKVKSSFHTNVNVTRSAMFPVWFMSYRNRNRVAYATVNGQTGKVSADVPMSIPKYLLCAFIIATVLFVVFQLFFTITPKILVLFVALLGMISVIMYNSEMKKIASLENYDDDLGMLDREKRVEEKKQARAQAQIGATFDGVPGADNSAYVVTKNDIARAKREKARQKKAKKDSSGCLVWIVVIAIAFIGFGSFIFEGIDEILDTGNLGIGGALVALLFFVVSLIFTIMAWKNQHEMKT
ncbi:hypothetical protein SAMN02910369_03079, partial [Lachnospiraceae bacterium NE2001]